MKMGYVLAAAVAGGALFAVLERTGVIGREPRPTAHAPAAPAPAPEQPGVHGGSLPPSEAPEEETLEGSVLETISVPNYTYLRLKATDGTEQWAAVSTANVSAGARVRVRSATRMTDFESPTLHRTFPAIYFGVLDGPGAPPSGSAMLGGLQVHFGAGPAAPSGSASAASGHGSVASSPATSASAVKPVSKAKGPNAHTIAEIYADRKALGGKPVRVRGVVVKSISGILGKTYVHLRDGSGDAEKGNHDLTVTLENTPVVGDTITVEGTLVLDRDLGSGYRYDVILENATLPEGG